MIKYNIKNISIGDVIIITNIEQIVSGEKRHLEEYKPYTVVDVFSSFFYIDCMGKDVSIYKCDFKSIEFIYSEKNVMDFKENNFHINEWDYIIILDKNKIEGAERLGFENNIRYEVIKSESDFIHITNDINTLMVKQEELKYLVNESDFEDEEVSLLISELEKLYKKNEIDRLLSNKDFDTLSQLISNDV